MDVDTRITLRVGDLFNAQAAEATYQRLVDFLNQQALEMQRLRAQLRDLEAQQSAKDAQAATLLDEKLAQVASRLAQLAAKSQLHEERNVGLAERVMRLEKTAMDAARERKEIRAEVVKVEQATTKMIFQIDQQLLHDRLSTIDRRLESKMEKILRFVQSESSRMDTLVTKINAFAPKSDQLFEKLADLENSQAQIFKTLEISEERWTSHKNEFSTVESRVKATELKADNAELLVKGTVTKQLAEQRDTNEAAQHALSAKFHSFAMVFTERLKQQSEAFEAMIAERARSADVLEKFEDIQSDLSEKAQWSDLQSLGEEVEGVVDQCRALEKHVRLSSRFMDWFATRGEAYEHNLDVVETQLGRIAYQSRPEVREPFGD